MRFTVIGHACLYIEFAGKSLLVDPWLFGSCYWRSWWHYPPNTEIRPEFLAPDYLYLSHHHFDHFHYPSLRRIAKTARVLCPRFGVGDMPREIAGLGFGDVTEIPHGATVALDGGARLGSYQYGVDDSALLVEHGGVVLADLNDCKIKGAAARPMLKAFGRPTFMFKSHSYAQAFPNCYTFADPRHAALMAREDFIETFYGAARELGPRYAVPFASMVAFLHPESRHCNGHAVRPPDVARDADGMRPDGVEVVTMAPGDAWDSAAGFALSGTDWYDGVEARLDAMADSVAATLARTAEAEARRPLRYDRFEAFFTRFLKALPPGARLVFNRPVAFHVPSDARPYWVVDPRRRAVRRAAAAPADFGSIVRIPEAVLADAIAKRVVDFVHISMRIRIECPAAGPGNDVLFWGLVTLFDLGYLPLRNCLTRRAVAVAWRRRREILLFALSLARRGSLTGSVFAARRTSRKERTEAGA